VLCRFTAFVAVDSRVVNENGESRRVVQPVESPSGWDLPVAATAATSFISMASASMPLAAPMPPAPGAPPRFTPMMAGGSAPGGRRRMGAQGAPVAAFARKAPPPGSTVDLDPILKMEVERLRAAEGRPDHERAELLDDLASRLDVLAPGVPALRDLVAVLRGGQSLTEKWAEAMRVLAGLGDDEPGERKAFWKR
jgi:Ca-activated chloride channel family protein